MKPKMVLVEWEDINVPPTAGWVDRETALSMKPMPCKTVGFLLKRNSRVVITVQNISEDGEYNTVEVIPAGCVIKIRRLV